MLISCEYVIVVQEKRFSEKIDELSLIHDRMRDVVDGIDWTLGKNPTIGTACEDDPDHFIIETISYGSTPDFWVLYRYDKKEGRVYLLSITPINSED